MEESWRDVVLSGSEESLRPRAAMEAEGRLTSAGKTDGIRVAYLVVTLARLVELPGSPALPSRVR